MKPSTRNTSMKRLGLELYQLTGENQNIPIKDVRAVVKKIKRKRLQVRMIMSSGKRKKLKMQVKMKLWISVTIILLFMNVEKTSSNKCMNEGAQHRIISRKYSKNLHSTHGTFISWIVHINIWRWMKIILTVKTLLIKI